MRKYETVYVLRPDLDEAAVEAANQSVARAISENGGEIEKTDVWGIRKLAYEIQDYTEGNYVVVTYQAESSIPAVDYVYKVSDSIIRSIVVRIDE